MKALEEKIVREGKILPGNVLKVSHFLNHQLDVDFLMKWDVRSRGFMKAPV